MSSARYLATMDEWMREQERRTRSLERRKRGLTSGGGGATTITVTDTATIDMVLTGSSAAGYGLSANVTAVPVSLLTGPGTIPPALLPTPAVPALGVTDTPTIDMTLTGAGTTASPWNVSSAVLAVPVGLLTGPGTIPPALLPAATSGRIPGEVIAYAGATTPSGWLLCNGGAVSRTTYSDLFTAIGTTYGVGDGSTTFNLPNLAGRTAIGQNATYPLGTAGGAETHTHTLTGPTAYAKIALTTNAGQPIINDRPNVPSWTGTHIQGSAAATAATASTGTGTSLGGSTDAGSTMQPYLALRYIIKT